MKAIILAAGYGVRLEEDLAKLNDNDRRLYLGIKGSIEGRAKPMVIISGKPLIEHIVKNLENIREIDQIIIVTNDKFFNQFEEWYINYKSAKEIKILNDGTSINEDRLGAVGDLLFVLDKEKINDDTLVIAGDNLFTFSLKELADFFHSKNSDVLLVYPEDREKIKRSACVDTDSSGRVVYFEEKPKEPRTNLACPAVHIYKKSTISLIKGMDFSIDIRDLIGNIPKLLYRKIPIYALKKDRKVRFDLGTVSDFISASEYLKKRKAQ